VKHLAHNYSMGIPTWPNVSNVMKVVPFALDQEMTNVRNAMKIMFCKKPVVWNSALRISI